MTDLNDLEARIAENEKHGLYTSPAVRELIEELKRLRHEVADLQMLRDEHLIDNLHATEEGRNEERAAVVAYLHHRANLWLNAEKIQRTEASMGVWLVCQAIERGEHRRKEEP
jgi:hypothetical protein